MTWKTHKTFNYDTNPLPEVNLRLEQSYHMDMPSLYVGRDLVYTGTPVELRTLAAAIVRACDAYEEDDDTNNGEDR